MAWSSFLSWPLTPSSKFLTYNYLYYKEILQRIFTENGSITISEPAANMTDYGSQCRKRDFPSRKMRILPPVGHTCRQGIWAWLRHTQSGELHGLQYQHPVSAKQKSDGRYYEHLYSRSANNYNFYGKPRNAVLRLKNGRLAAWQHQAVWKPVFTVFRQPSGFEKTETVDFSATVV